MDIALHKHSANMNILPNPDEGLRKRICLPRHGGGRRAVPQSNSASSSRGIASDHNRLPKISRSFLCTVADGMLRSDPRFTAGS
jgi:hypothetical protein